MTTAFFADQWIHCKRPVSFADDSVILTDALTAFWGDWRIRVKPGYQTDGASIKTRTARFIVGHPWAEYLAAAVIHDILYETETFERDECDRIFLALMDTLGVSWWKRRTMHAAVRVGGWWPWRKHTADTRAKAAQFLELTHV